MNVFTALAAVIIHLWVPLLILVSVVAVAGWLAWAAVRRPKDALPERPSPGKGLIRARAGDPAHRPGSPVGPASGEPFNDARDVWPMPQEDWESSMREPRIARASVEVGRCWPKIVLDPGKSGLRLGMSPLFS